MRQGNGQKGWVALYQKKITLSVIKIFMSDLPWNSDWWRAYSQYTNIECEVYMITQYFQQILGHHVQCSQTFANSGRSVFYC